MAREETSGRRGGRRIGMPLAAAFAGMVLAAATPAAATPPRAKSAAAQGTAELPVLQPVIDAVVRKGPASQLPAHLSVLLGLTKAEQGVPVRQAVMRDAVAVHTFNVVQGDHSQVVLLTYEAGPQLTKAYRISPAGRLQKALAYRGADPATERSAQDAKGDFDRELGFWTKFQRPVAKP